MADDNKLFVVTAADDPAKLGPRIEQEYAESQLSVEPGLWLVAAPSTNTTSEVCRKLGITVPTDDENFTGPAIVFTATAYFGRSNPSVWEWIEAKLGSSNVSGR